MLESNSHVLKRPLFTSGVHADCHRCAGTKRSQQQIIGRSPSIFAAGRNRYIGRYSMPADTDLLSEAVSASTDDNPVFHNHVVYHRSPGEVPKSEGGRRWRVNRS